MSAVIARRDTPHEPRAARQFAHAAAALHPAIAVGLIGTGLVGGAVLRRLAQESLPLSLVGVANSRRSLIDGAGLPLADLLARLGTHGDAADIDGVIDALRHSSAPTRVLIDATPSAQIAQRHAEWLAAGVHVVSANKIALGTSLQQWSALHEAAFAGGTRYGDAATVGAGLPALATVRRLRRGGDQVTSVHGVFSGSLSFLFNRLDGQRSFSRLLAEAFERGYTEPDPRADLNGADVARKLLILARAAGFQLEPEDISVESLVPEELAALPVAEFSRRLPELDAQIEARRAAAAAAGKVLRYLARFDLDGGARVSLEAVAPSHPAAQLSDADNIFVISTTRYRESPLVVRGPGAGAEITAQALLSDVFEIAA